MTPNKVEILLHFYCSPTLPHPRQTAFSTAEDIEDLVECGAICPTGDGYKTTEKGEAWVEMICSTPEPLTLYVDPRDAPQTIGS